LLKVATVGKGGIPQRRPKEEGGKTQGKNRWRMHHIGGYDGLQPSPERKKEANRKGSQDGYRSPSRKKRTPKWKKKYVGGEKKRCVTAGEYLRKREVPN